MTNSTDIGLKKASPEALALLMRNIKKDGGHKKVWVPSGGATKKSQASGGKKLYF